MSSRSFSMRPALFAMAAAIVGMFTAASCGTDEEGASPCETVYADRCGEDCVSDSGCGEGLFCGSSGTCTAECTPGGVECEGGETCSDHGRCGGDDDGSGLLPDGSGGGSGDGCADVHVTFEQQIPTVVLLIDQSGSMTEDFSGGTRWSVLRQTLTDPQSGLIANLEDVVRFGLALYTSDGGFSGGTCPQLAQVQTSLGNYAQIKSVYDSAGPGGDTPTGESINAVAQQLAALDVEGPKIIVLATDGEPDTCAVPNPQNGQPEAIAAAQAAYGAGVQTFIISVGADVGIQHLQDMANAGAGLAVNGGNDAPYYQALDQASLISAFDNIIDGVRGCIFTLDGEVVGDPAAGTVVLDGEPLTYGDPNGWKLNNANEVELVGAACEAIQDGEHDLDVSFPCGDVEVDDPK